MADEQVIETPDGVSDGFSLYQGPDGSIDPVESPIGTTIPDPQEKKEQEQSEAESKPESNLDDEPETVPEAKDDSDQYKDLENKMRQEYRQNMSVIQKQLDDQIQKITDAVTNQNPVAQPESQANRFDDLKKELADSDDYVSPEKMLELLDAQKDDILGSVSNLNNDSSDYSVRDELEAIKQEKRAEQFWSSYGEKNPEVENPRDVHNKLVQSCLDRGMSDEYAQAYAHGMLDNTVTHRRKTGSPPKDGETKDPPKSKSQDSTSGASEMTPGASGNTTLAGTTDIEDGVFNDGLRIFKPGPQK